MTSLTTEDARPLPVGLVERVIWSGIHDVPGSLLDLSFELARSPTRIAGIDADGASEAAGSYRHVRKADPGECGAFALGSRTEGYCDGRFNGSPEMDQPRLRDERGPIPQVICDLLHCRAVEDDTQGPLIIVVLEQKHHGPPEVGVDQQGSGDEELAGQG